MEISKFYVGREKKVKRPFRRLFFCARGGRGKTGAERLPERTGVACPLGEDWSGGLPDFRRGLGIMYKTGFTESLNKCGLTIPKKTKN
jgi:hypothetical protein